MRREGLVGEEVAEELLPAATLGALLDFHLAFFRDLRERRNIRPQVGCIPWLLEQKERKFCE